MDGVGPLPCREGCISLSLAEVGFVGRCVWGALVAADIEGFDSGKLLLCLSLDEVGSSTACASWGWSMLKEVFTKSAPGTVQYTGECNWSFDLFIFGQHDDQAHLKLGWELRCGCLRWCRTEQLGL